MDGRSFDTLTRRAGLLAFGGAGLAMLAQTNFAEGKKKRNKKKGDVNQLCKKQVEQCETALLPACGNPPDPECVAAIELCCPEWATCDILGFFACVQSSATTMASEAVSRLGRR